MRAPCRSAAPRPRLARRGVFPRRAPPVAALPGWGGGGKDRWRVRPIRYACVCGRREKWQARRAGVGQCEVKTNKKPDLPTHSPDEVNAAAELQAAAFYSSYPLGPLDALLFYTFRVRRGREGGGQGHVTTHSSLSPPLPPAFPPLPTHTLRAKSCPASSPR